MLHWALTAAAILMLLIAIRTLFLSGRKGQASRAKLGVSFSLVAAGLWIYVLQDHLGELWPAIRLGVAILFALPAVSAIANPGGARILRAVAGLIIAVFLAGPVVQDLWAEFGPDGRSKQERQVGKLLDEITMLRAEYSSRRDQLARLETTAVEEVRALGTDWDRIEADPEAIKKLELLTGVRAEISQIDEALQQLGAREKQLTASLLAEESSPAVAAQGEDAQLESLRRQLESKTDASDLGVVERHLRNQELRELFDRERRSN